MASFRYRVFAGSKIVAGFLDVETALEMGRSISLKTGGSVIVYDHRHGTASDEDVQIGWFFKGDRVPG
jgi:hypothetical protein